MLPSILCETYPKLQVSNTNSFKDSAAHYLRSGIVNPFFIFDKGVSTNIGLTHSTSISGYQQARPSVKFRLKAFVAEYRLKQGTVPSCIQEDRLMSALLCVLFFILARTSAERAAMLTQLMLIMSTICQYVNLWKKLTSEVPTLFTNSPISKDQSYDISFLYLVLSEESLKSKAIILNSALLFSGLSFFRFDTVVFNFQELRETKTILNPSLASTSQKPSPIPSVAPVTTAQDWASSLQYLLRRLGSGSRNLATQQTTVISHLNRGKANTITSRSHQLMPVSWLIILQSMLNNFFQNYQMRHLIHKSHPKIKLFYYIKLQISGQKGKKKFEATPSDKTQSVLRQEGCKIANLAIGLRKPSAAKYYFSSCIPSTQALLCMISLLSSKCSSQREVQQARRRIQNSQNSRYKCRMIYILTPSPSNLDFLYI